MTNSIETAEATMLSPDDAFAVLGNETRVAILRALAAADEPVAFSELRDRVGTPDSGQFNYHLGKLVGHFVRKSDGGYVLRQAGRRVIEAVLSGAVTEAVVLEPTRLDAPCPYCGAAIEVSYLEERLLTRCTECVGSFAGAESSSEAFETLPGGTLTLYYLPSAGIQGRSPLELLDAALAWSFIELDAVANGICPRCAGRVVHAVDVCADHEADGGVCDRCNTRFAVIFVSRCTNCDRKAQGTIKYHLLADPAVRSFFETRGIDTLAPAWEDMAALYDYEEEVLGTDPFEARVTFTVAGDDLAVVVDDALTVIDVEHE